MICNNDSYIANIDISKEMRLYDINTFYKINDYESVKSSTPE